MIELPPLSTGRRPVDIDDVLRGYFHAEMPHPWPRLRLPAPRLPVRASLWHRSRMRLALAASVLLLLSGYLVLAGRFPQATPGNGIERGAADIANNPLHHRRTTDLPVRIVPNSVERVKTPQGRDAKVLEETTQGARGTILINVQEETPKARR